MTTPRPSFRRELLALVDDAAEAERRLDANSAVQRHA